MPAHLIICMGVSGVGKTTYAQKLAHRFDLEFIDADTFHSAANKHKMQEGIPLSNADREPWMQAVCKYLRNCAEKKFDCVLAHSALRRTHREQLRNCGLTTRFLHFDAPLETLSKRLMERENHFMPASLLESQFSTLESTEGECDVIKIDTASSKKNTEVNVFTEVATFISGE